MLQSLFVCRRLLTGGTFIPVSLIAVVPTVLEKSVFYGYLAVASVSLGLPTQFVHCCLAATRAFLPASLIVIPLGLGELCSKTLLCYAPMLSNALIMLLRIVIMLTICLLYNIIHDMWSRGGELPRVTK